MKLRLTGPAKKDMLGLEANVRKQLRKQLEFLLQDLRYPSLNAKKFEEAGEGIWQARVNRSHRFYFLIDDDSYVILRIIEHPK